MFSLKKQLATHLKEQEYQQVLRKKWKIPKGDRAGFTFPPNLQMLNVILSEVDPNKTNSFDAFKLVSFVFFACLES